MPIRLEHQPSGAVMGTAAYLSGRGQARQRKQKYAMDLYRDQQRMQARRQEQFAGFKYREHLQKMHQQTMETRDEKLRGWDLEEAAKRRSQELADVQQQQEFRQQETDLAYGREQVEGYIPPIPKHLQGTDEERDLRRFNQEERELRRGRDFDPNDSGVQNRLAEIRAERQRILDNNPPPSMDEEFAKGTRKDEFGVWQQQGDEWKLLAKAPEDPGVAAAEEAKESARKRAEWITKRTDALETLQDPTTLAHKYATRDEARSQAIKDYEADQAAFGQFADQSGGQQAFVDDEGLLRVGPPEQAPGTQAPAKSWTKRLSENLQQRKDAAELEQAMRKIGWERLPGGGWGRPQDNAAAAVSEAPTDADRSGPQVGLSDTPSLESYEDFVRRIRRESR